MLFCFPFKGARLYSSMDVGQNPVPPVNLKVDGHPLYHMISRFWPIPRSILGYTPFSDTPISPSWSRHRAYRAAVASIATGRSPSVAVPRHWGSCQSRWPHPNLTEVLGTKTRSTIVTIVYGRYICIIYNGLKANFELGGTTLWRCVLILKTWNIGISWLSKKNISSYLYSKFPRKSECLRFGVWYGK